MQYTHEERTKIHENLDKIKNYLDGLRPQLRDEVTVDFGPVKTYADFSREPAFHITVDKNGISCRSGGLCFDFEKDDKATYDTSAYTQFDYAVSLIQNWLTVKSCVNNAIKEQDRMLADIKNFEI